MVFLFLLRYSVHQCPHVTTHTWHLHPHQRPHGTCCDAQVNNPSPLSSLPTRIHLFLFPNLVSSLHPSTLVSSLLTPSLHPIPHTLTSHPHILIPHLTSLYPHSSYPYFIPAPHTLTSSYPHLTPSPHTLTSHPHLTPTPQYCTIT